jgi:hypothetical protein
MAGAKKVALMSLGLAAQKYGTKLSDEQEILGYFADIAMETYGLESVLLRARKRAEEQGEAACALQEAVVQCYAREALDKIESFARPLLAAIDEGDMLRTYAAALRRFTKREPVNVVALRRLIANAAVEKGGYPL